MDKIFFTQSSHVLKSSMTTITEGIHIRNIIEAMPIIKTLLAIPYIEESENNNSPEVIVKFGVRANSTTVNEIKNWKLSNNKKHDTSYLSSHRINSINRLS
jgi:hypothetical protein